MYPNVRYLHSSSEREPVDDVEDVEAVNDAIDVILTEAPVSTPTISNAIRCIRTRTATLQDTNEPRKKRRKTSTTERKRLANAMNPSGSPTFWNTLPEKEEDYDRNLPPSNVRPRGRATGRGDVPWPMALYFSQEAITSMYHESLLIE